MISQTSGFSFFCQNGDRYHRGFMKFQNFDGQHSHYDNMHHRTKLGSDR